MKLLTKIKLINWHYFWNESFNIDQIVFLTGLNGSGKSTLVDAFEVVLLGDTSGRSFNKAALDKSARTLKGYLRGELGDDQEGGFKYLRNGRFTSYIALEFHDDVENKDFTMGIVFDSYDDGSEEHRFFNVEAPIPENEFIVDNVPLSYKDLAAYLSENYAGSYRFFDSNKQYQEFLKRRFGGLKDKYFSLLKKATSFTPITDITTFITEYVCDPQQNLDLTHLQDNIIQYSKLKLESENIERRIERLEEIKTSYESYKDIEKDFNVSKYFIDRCELFNSEEKVKAFKNEVIKSEERIHEIESELEEHAATIKELEKRKYKLIQDRTNNDVAKITEDIYIQKRDTEEKIRAIKNELNGVKDTLMQYIESYEEEATNLIDELSAVDKDAINDEDKEEEILNIILSSKKVKEVSIKIKTKLDEDLMLVSKTDLETFKDALKEFKDNVSSLATSLARITANLEKKIQSLKEEELMVKKGSKSFDHRLKSIKEALQTELSNRFNKKIEVELFCDLIDIKDQSWANAIEGYLYNQKFNLFVPPKYYSEAYKILRRILEEYHYYATALVDQEKIIERNFNMEEGSLAEEIETTHEGARAYTNYLIGRLYKAGDIEEARDSGNGITRSCDLYRAFSLTKMNPRLYQESFIGVKINDRFIEEKQAQLRANNQNLSVYKTIYRAITEANNLEVLTSGEIEHLLKIISRGNELKGLNSSLEYFNSELESHDTALLESLDKRLKDVEEDIKEITKLKDDVLIEKGNLTHEIESLKTEKIVNEEKSIEARKEALKDKYSKDFVDIYALPLLNEQLNRGRTYFDILTEANSSLSRLQYLSNNLFSSLCKLRREYVHDYHLSYDPDVRDNEVFQKELIEFKEVKLPEYREKIHDSYLKATQQFKDDFIFKLRSAIEEVEDQISNLNEALEQSSFGRDSYRFTVKPSITFKRYYDMLKDDIILEGGEDESLFLDKYKDVMEDLFKQIVDVNNLEENNEELLKNIEKFTDYRSYLDFDLIVYNRENNEEQRLSKMIKKKSGGETQTPFYISVLASFAQLYHVNEEGEIANTSRLIIFDEAFSKMDRGRIKEAVKLLRKFNLQVIISCPTDKVADISELVDETLVVLHNKNTSNVLTFKEISQNLN